MMVHLCFLDCSLGEVQRKHPVFDRGVDVGLGV